MKVTPGTVASRPGVQDVHSPARRDSSGGGHKADQAVSVGMEADPGSLSMVPCPLYGVTSPWLPRESNQRYVGVIHPQLRHWYREPRDDVMGSWDLVACMVCIRVGLHRPVSDLPVASSWTEAPGQQTHGCERVAGVVAVADDLSRWYSAVLRWSLAVGAALAPRQERLRPVPVDACSAVGQQDDCEERQIFDRLGHSGSAASRSYHDLTELAAQELQKMADNTDPPARCHRDLNSSS